MKPTRVIPNYERGLCVHCENPFTEGDWADRHSDPDGFDIHEECCRECGPGGTWVPPHPTVLLFRDPATGDYEEVIEPAVTILIDSEGGLTDGDEMTDETYAAIRMLDDAALAAVDFDPEWIRAAAQVAERLHEVMTVTGIAAMADTAGIDVHTLMKFLTKWGE